MLSLTGTVLNVFQAPAGQTKDGEKYGGDYRVQLQGKNILRNNEVRVDLVTLGCKSPDAFREVIGKEVRVPVGAFVNGKAVQYYLTSDSVEVC